MRNFRRWLPLVMICCSAPWTASAQSTPGTAVQPSRLVVYEYFAGDTNADGQVMALNSSATYYFTDHFSVRAGIPIYFDRIPSTVASNPTTPSAATFSSGIGDIFLALRAAWKAPVLNYGTGLTATAPTGETSKGFSTGHFTFDWSNRFDRSFGIVTPFVDAGLANSVTDTPYFLRPFATLGPLAHFEGGAALKIVRAVNVTFSGYDIAPWGTQTIISRVVTATSSAKSGAASRKPFENAHQTTGTANLTRDDGFAASLLVSPNSYLDLNLGYTRSAPYGLNTVSFGVGVNVTELFGQAHHP